MSLKTVVVFLVACAVTVLLVACEPTPPAYHHWSEVPVEIQEEYSPEVIQAWIDAYWVNEWIRAYNWNKWMEEASKRTGYGYVDGIEVCNGIDLPTCGIVHRESRFNPNARNPHSTAWGLYQFLRGTWRSVCPEYPHGSASVAQQVECARRLWDGGRGKSHWRLTA